MPVAPTPRSIVYTRVPVPFAFPATLVDGIRMGRGVLRNITITTANTDQTIAHNLGRIPVGYMLIRTAQGSTLYDGSNAGSDWTPVNIVLRDNVKGDVIWAWIY